MISLITVDVNTVLHSCFYTGKKHKLVRQDVTTDHTIKANSGTVRCPYQIHTVHSGESFKLDIPYSEYSQKFGDDQMSMKCVTVVKENKTQKSVCDQIDFQINNPASIEVKVYTV